MSDLQAYADALIERVHRALEERMANPRAPLPDAARRIIESRAHEALDWLSGEIEDRDDNPLRASSAGKCPRGVAYKIHHPGLAAPKEAHVARILGVGNKLHDLEREFLALAGVRVIAEEERVELDLSTGHVLTGHLDDHVELGGAGWGLDPLEFILDFKTMNPNAYDRFARDLRIPDYYLSQLHVYMFAKDVPRAILYAVDKAGGRAIAAAVAYDHGVFLDAVAKFEEAARSTPDALPERPYRPEPYLKDYKRPANADRNVAEMRLPWQCRYCDFVAACRPEFALRFEAGKPVYARPMTASEEALARGEEPPAMTLRRRP